MNGNSEEHVVLEEVRSFGETTTIHGFSYVCDRKIHKFRRFMWVAFILGAGGALIYELIGSIRKFNTRPVSSTMIEKHVLSTTFPAVTVCNHNLLKADSVDPSLREKLEAITFDGARMNWDIFFNSSGSSNLTELLITCGHRIEDMLKMCRWGMNKNCTAEDFTERMTDFGLCYTFNADDDNARSTSHAGSSYGLMLLMDIQQDQYLWSESGGAGIKIFVHPPNEYPLMKLHGISAPPGAQTDISLTYEKRTYLPPPHEPYCREENLTYSDNYTAELCKHECEIKAVVDECGCKDFRDPGPARVCGSQGEMDCIYEKQASFAEQTTTMCECPEPCLREKYKPRISNARWPCNNYRKRLADRYSVTQEYISDNFLEANIFFEEMSIDEITENEDFDFLAFSGEMGGVTGLLIGASLLSLAEIFDFLMCILHHFACHGRRRGRKTKDSESERIELQRLKT